MIRSIISLIIGVIIGYLGQRSGACFISGYRDLFLFRDRYLFKAVIGVIIGATIGFSAFSLVGGYVPSYPLLMNTPGIQFRGLWIMTLAGGIGFGFFSTLVGGCPFRLHVRAAEGDLRAISYLLGFYAGAIYFYLYLLDIVSKFIAI